MAEPTKPDPKKPLEEAPPDAAPSVSAQAAAADAAEPMAAEPAASDAAVDATADAANEPVASTGAPPDDADAQAEAIMAEQSGQGGESSISADELEAAMKAFNAGEAPKPAAAAPSTATAASKVDEDAVAAAMMASLAAAETGGAQSADFGAEPFVAPSFDSPRTGLQAGPLDLLDDVELDVTVELGRAEMYIEDVLKLGVGSVVELDKLAGDPVDIYVNAQLVARGEVLVLNDNFCVRVNDIVSPVPEGDGRK